MLPRVREKLRSLVGRAAPCFYRSTRALHRTLIFPVLDVLLPSDCFGCGLPLGPVQYLGACLPCWTGLTPIPDRSCPRCGLPSVQDIDPRGPQERPCGACILAPLPVDAVKAAVRYDPLARRFLLRAKQGARRELLSALGDQLARIVQGSGFAREVGFVVPVPAHPLALLRRGFNPALEIAKPVAERLDLPLLPRLLSRRWRRWTASKGLSARNRWLAVSEAFRAAPRARGQRILLVDDVLTTAATIAASATALRRAGAVEVRAAVWARTPRRWSGSV